MKKENIDTHSTLVPNSIKLSTERQTRTREADQGPAAKGQALLKKSLQGDRLSASQAIKAKCYDCMGYFEDGKGDCGDPLCPLYPWMPYAQKRDPPACTNRALPEKKSDAPDRGDAPQSGNLQDTRGAGV